MISIRCGKETLIHSNFWVPKDIYSQRIYNTRHRKYNFARHQQGNRQVQLVNPTPTLESFKRPVITCSNSWILRHNPNENYNERDQLAPVWKALVKKSRERKFKKKKWQERRNGGEADQKRGRLLCCIWHINGYSHEKNRRGVPWQGENSATRRCGPPSPRDISGETQLSKRQVTHEGTIAPFTTHWHVQHTERSQTHESRGSDPWTWWKETQARRRKERPLHEHRSIQG